MSTKETDVLIVGGGPVGLSLANELSYRGINAIILERKTATSTVAKAVGLNSRSMEHYRRLGVSRQIQNASFPRDLKFNIGMYSSVLNGRTNFKQEFGSWGELAEGRIKKSYPFYDEGASPEIPMFCAQNISEPLLKQHLEETSNCVNVCFGQEVVAISQNDHGVEARGKSVTTGEELLYKAKYLALCDGGKSQCRKQLGIQTVGQFVIARACSIMFNSPEMYQQMQEEGKTGFSVVNNAQLHGVVITANDTGDFLFHIFLQSTASNTIVEGFVQNPEQAVRIAMGSDLPLNIIACTSYNIHSVITTKFRDRRCFLAGDSAHQWLPAGGLGMNTGIGDAADLAWKLEAVIKGHGGENLLQSYEEERQPMVDSTRRFAMFLSGNVLFESSLELYIRKLMTMTAFTRYLLGMQIGRVLSPAFSSSNQLVLGYQFINSSIVMHEYTSTGEMVQHKPTKNKMFSAIPGCRAPHVSLDNSTSVIDIFGKTFVVLIIGGKENHLSSLKEELARCSVPFAVHVYPNLPHLVAMYDRKYFLVRPDGVISWRGDYQPSMHESKVIVATVTGHTKMKRLPRLLWNQSVPIPSHFSMFLSDLLIRASTSYIFVNCFNLSLVSSWTVGFTLFWLMRACHTALPSQYLQSTSRHSAVTLNQFGSTDVLEIVNSHTTMFGPNNVLIKVHAASVDAVDCEMRQGKNWTTQVMFPLILGRGCSGEVVAVGDEVSAYLPGDLVIAAAPLHCQGTHSQLVAVDKEWVGLKPAIISHQEAASLPWIASKVWPAFTQCGLNRYTSRGKRVLVTGKGPEASFIAQLLKAWGAQVTMATCVDLLVDNSQPHPCDIVLDTCAHKHSLSISCKRYISFHSPELSLSRKLGRVVGAVAFSWLYRFKVIVHRLLYGCSFYFSSPASGCGLKEMASIVDRGEVQTNVECVFAMKEVASAHQCVEEGLAGTVILSLID